MKRTRIGIAALLAVSLVFATACSSGKAPEEQAAPPTEEQLWDLVEEAYIYSYPLVIMEATGRKATNVEQPTPVQAPINQWCHAAGLVDASFKDVLKPNQDTVYSQAYLDLVQEPLVLEKPAADRFLAIELFDFYTNFVQMLGTGGDTQQARTYLLCGPDYAGEVPEGMVRVSLPTNQTWMLARIIIYGDDDIAAVRALQGAMRLVPLSAYQAGGEYLAPKGSVSAEYDYLPLGHVAGMGMQEYFSLANELMVKNPPADIDAPLLERVAQINVGPGLAFDESLFGEDAKGRWDALVSRSWDLVWAEAEKFMIRQGDWLYYGPPVSQFGTEYGYRAYVAMDGQGANPLEQAIYMQLDPSGEGEGLPAGQSYRLRIEQGQLPPTEEYGFWSLTVYGKDGTLIDNPIDRYCINDRSEVVFAEDGSLELLLQPQPPEDEAQLANWLPIAEEGFQLYLRIYLPGKGVLDRSWHPPAVEAV